MKHIRPTGFFLACSVALVLAAAPASAQRRPDLGPALAAQAHYSDNLLQIPGVAGTAVGLGANGQPVVKIYTEKSGIGGLPQILDGIAVQIQVPGKIVPLAPPPGKGGGHDVDPTPKFDKPVPLGVSSGSVASIQSIPPVFITCTSGTLGLEVRKTHTVGGVKVVRLGAVDTGLGLFDAAEKRAPRVPHHTFDIEGPDDPNEFARELGSKGLKVDDIRVHDGGRGYSVYVIDPGCNRLELSKSA